jgi:preprotein translocase subunit YajC
MKAEADYDPVSLVADHISARAAEQHQAEVEGRVDAVDAAAMTVAILPEHGAEVTLHADAATRISRNGAAATLADLRVGDRADARYDAATFVASRIEARSEAPPQQQEIEGKVTAVAAAAVTITPEHGSAVTLAIDTTTRIFLHDAAATLADVKVGQRAHASYNGTTLVASILRVQNEDPESQSAEVEGKVTAVSATSITIAPEHSSPVTLTIDATTRITRDDHVIAVGDIRVDDRADAHYDRTTMLAQRIQIEGDHEHHD